ncbi:hypothetical protein [Paeniglutamicibacter sulfureus]|uniref:Uncharacterized protein n=1 Tax=Paeniglutamicibacter sulfureus TaxID=43666 RepID=A0ABU2BCR3_9MICC|nr:hypothetical protein [Paeniglutamicibacter sulfureus]MDR7356385.1 hypothetical protein [Paeniglutamicibacter sulfureus]
MSTNAPSKSLINASLQGTNPPLGKVFSDLLRSLDAVPKDLDFAPATKNYSKLVAAAYPDLNGTMADLAKKVIETSMTPELKARLDAQLKPMPITNKKLIEATTGISSKLLSIMKSTGAIPESTFQTSREAARLAANVSQVFGNAINKATVQRLIDQINELETAELDEEEQEASTQILETYPEIAEAVVATPVYQSATPTYRKLLLGMAAVFVWLGAAFGTLMLETNYPMVGAIMEDIGAQPIDVATLAGGGVMALGFMSEKARRE